MMDIRALLALLIWCLCIASGLGIYCHFKVCLISRTSGVTSFGCFLECTIKGTKLFRCDCNDVWEEDIWSDMVETESGAAPHPAIMVALRYYSTGYQIRGLLSKVLPENERVTHHVDGSFSCWRKRNTTGGHILTIMDGKTLFGLEMNSTNGVITDSYTISNETFVMQRLGKNVTYDRLFLQTGCPLLTRKRTRENIPIIHTSITTDDTTLCRRFYLTRDWKSVWSNWTKYSEVPANGRGEPSFVDDSVVKVLKRKHGAINRQMLVLLIFAVLVLFCMLCILSAGRRREMLKDITDRYMSSFRR